jgi:hypothetical protein
MDLVLRFETDAGTWVRVRETSEILTRGLEFAFQGFWLDEKYYLV